MSSECRLHHFPAHHLFDIGTATDRFRLAARLAAGLIRVFPVNPPDLLS
jgi:hypothetical protein